MDLELIGSISCDLILKNNYLLVSGVQNAFTTKKNKLGFELAKITDFLKKLN